MTVHAFGDERVHLALAHRGRLKQGRLATLCGKMAVTELSPFAAAGRASDRCRVCFAKVDEDGLVKAPSASESKAKASNLPRPTAKILPGPKPKPRRTQ